MCLFDETVYSADNPGTLAEFSAINEMLGKLDEISPDARDTASYALLYGNSDFFPAAPPLVAIRRFVQKVLNAAEKAAGAESEEARRFAEQSRADRLDPDTEQVQTAAHKVRREFDRLCGLLRFNPEPVLAQHKTAVCYTARCAPDHFVLPLFADHFWQRFGKQSWIIIDEKRKLVLSSHNGQEPVLHRLPPKYAAGLGSCRAGDEWEELWKNYHRSINNEDRSNPTLQKQFMPRRYWKYLTELD